MFVKNHLLFGCNDLCMFEITRILHERMDLMKEVIEQKLPTISKYSAYGRLGLNILLTYPVPLFGESVQFNAPSWVLF